MIEFAKARTGSPVAAAEVPLADVVVVDVAATLALLGDVLLTVAAAGTTADVVVDDEEDASGDMICPIQATIAETAEEIVFDVFEPCETTTATIAKTRRIETTLSTLSINSPSALSSWSSTSA